MPEKNEAFIAELAQQIVTLADFWRRKTTIMKPGADLRIIGTLIETGLALDEEYAEPIARLVLRELDALDSAGCSKGDTATNWRVEVVFTLLLQYAGTEREPSTLFETSTPL